MEAGLYWASDDYRLTLTGQLTATGGGGYTGLATAGLRTSYDTLPTAWDYGIELGVTRENDGATSTTTGVCKIDALGINTTVSMGSGSSVTLEFRCSLKIWRLASMVWRTEIRNMALWVNGSLNTSYADPSTMPESLFGALSYIPLFGHSPELHASGGFNPVPPDSLNLQVENFAYGGEAAAGGGWSHDGVAHPLDVQVYPADPPGCCSASFPYPAFGATSTANASVSGEGWFRSTAVLRETQTITQGGLEAQPRIEELYDCTRSTDASFGRLWLLPDLDQGVIKSIDQYSALIGRVDMPQVVASVGGECSTRPTSDPLDDPAINSSTIETHPTTSDFVGHVQTVAHPMEDVFSRRMLAPVIATGSIQKRTGTKVVVVQAGIFADPGPEPSPPSYVEASTYCRRSGDSVFPVVATTSIASIYNVSTDLGRYTNTWANRLASHFYWFPPEWTEEDPAPATAWLVQGQRATGDEYWLPLRSQWMGNSFLPAGDKTDTRNSIIGAGLSEDIHKPFLADHIAGRNTSFWGISRFHVDNAAPLEEFVWRQTDTGSFTTENCTLTFNPTRIVVNPSAATCEVRLDVAGFDREPFLYPHLCDRYWLDWDTANVTSIAVYLENLEGQRLLIADAPLADWRKAGTMMDTKFAGSWPQDFTQGVPGIVDAGADVDPDGDSVGRMSDAESVYAFQLHGGRTRWRIVWVITPTDTALDVELHYPRIAVSEGKGAAANAVPIHENGHQTALVWASGPGVRYGGWSWLRTSPTVVLLTIPDINLVSSPPSGASLAEALRAAGEQDWVNQSTANGFTLPQNLNRTLGY